MRKYDIDHLRCGIVLLVVLYHVFYLLNTVGIPTSVAVPGIPALDIIEYILYPWFMTAMFLLAGISAWHSLQRRTLREFWHERLLKLVVPTVGGFFLLGWINGLLLYQYVDVFGGAAIPLPLKYLIFCLMGIGPQWFLQQLLVNSVVLTLFLLLDKKGRLWALGAKAASWPALAALGILFWGCSHLLNPPIITVYRNGAYIFSFLAGFYVFSHEEIITLLARRAGLLCIGAAAAGVWFVASYWRQDFTDPACLASLPAVCYTWLMILAMLGAARRWLSHEDAFTRWMQPRSFAFYLLHYPPMAVSAWLFGTVLALPAGAVYALILLCSIVMLPLLYEIVRRIPGLRFWLIGISAPAKAPGQKITSSC